MYAHVMSFEDRSPRPDGETSPTQLLLRVAQERDRGALAALFSAYGPRVKSMLMKQGAADAMADDLVQETFINVWRKAGLYSPERGAVATWIYAIARNLRIDQMRRQSNKPYEDLEAVELASDDPIGSTNLEQQQVMVRVTRALAALPPEQQEVVRLSFIQDMPHARIAEVTGIPLGTVKSRLRLAYERLRPMLEDLQ